MKQSKLFTKTRKQAPSDEQSKNAQLLMQAGYVHKELAGVYTFLPLGLRVLNNIADIIREEMDALGGLEMQSSALQNPEVWKTTRWDDEVVDVWFKPELHSGQELGLAFSHEEPLTEMLTHHIHSYRDLPVYLYDIKTVFRNELRAKSGLMRGREFFWKALYSFSENNESHENFYDAMKETYQRIFTRLGIADRTFLTFASGGSFAPYSHEFQTISDAGEDTIYIHHEKGIAVNKEVYTDEVLGDLNLKKDDLKEARAIEVGNIFSLGTKFSDARNLKFMNRHGKPESVIMGSYGIGISRLFGVLAEEYSDEQGLVLPANIAPFQVHLLFFGDNETLFTEAEGLYHDLKKIGVEVLFDNRRDVRPGEKLNDADLIGTPYRLVVSEKSREQGGVEFKARAGQEVQYLDTDRVTHFVKEQLDNQVYM